MYMEVGRDQRTSWFGLRTDCRFGQSLHTDWKLGWVKLTRARSLSGLHMGHTHVLRNIEDHPAWDEHHKTRWKLTIARGV